MRKPRVLPQTLTVKRSEQEPEAMELVAKAILDIQDAFARMSRVAKPALIVLILHDLTGVGKPAIRSILAAAPKIKETYLK